MKTFLGYKRNQDGTISIIDVECSDGELYAEHITQLIPTNETTTLRGWPDEGPARVYVTSGGIEVIIPLHSHETH
jgi:hypothetical protein